MTLYSARIQPARRVGAIPHEGYLYISATNPPSKDALYKGLSTYFYILFNAAGQGSAPARFYLSACFFFSLKVTAPLPNPRKCSKSKKRIDSYLILRYYNIRENIFFHALDPSDFT